MSLAIKTIELACFPLVCYYELLNRNNFNIRLELELPAAAGTTLAPQKESPFGHLRRRLHLELHLGLAQLLAAVSSAGLSALLRWSRKGRGARGGEVLTAL